MKNLKSILSIFIALAAISCNNSSPKHSKSNNLNKIEHKDVANSNQEKKRGNFQKILIKKQKSGIDFYATGNEPFWSLDIDFDKIFKFKTFEGIEFDVPAVEPTMGIDGNLTQYAFKTEFGEMILQLNHSECIDNMSGNKFNYAVIIDFKTSKESKFKGCGSFIPDFRLHNIWAIKEVDGVIINPNDFIKGPPKLELNTSSGLAIGNDGCNNFRAKIEIEKGKIIFGNLASTMMACPNIETSSKITNVISKRTLSFNFENNYLVFLEHDKILMKLKKID